ncbi:tigger transposable element-derived protein 4-like, partial [Aphis craccivora]
MYNLITHENGLRFENIYLYSKTSNQEKYVFADKVIKPNLTKNNSIIIFDDVICGPLSVIREYFSICRHSGASSHTYSKIPKQLVRDNSNFLIILKQDDTNLQHIFNDHSSADMDFIEFRKISHLCWNHTPWSWRELIDEKTYRICSAICHHGESLHHGHYTNLIKKSNLWFRCNDLTSNKERWPKGGKDIYMLILEKQN